MNDNEGDDDGVKTGCMGILIPLATAAFGIYHLFGPRRLDLMGHPRTRDDVIGDGIAAIGIALFVHALGFGPYSRVNFLKYALAAGGVGLFVYGLSWPH